MNRFFYLIGLIVSVPLLMNLAYKCVLHIDRGLDNEYLVVTLMFAFLVFYFAYRLKNHPNDQSECEEDDGS